MQNNTIRCKFRCNGVEETLQCVSNPDTNAWEWKTLYKARMTVVTGETPENKSFFQWTPCGEISVGLLKEKQFIVGKEYYVDITLAE